jgi:single-stranded-DNA-specific exonuclease
VFDDGWHPGVVGVVASRLARKYHRPCIVLGREGSLAKGSGRTVPGISLVDVLGRCSHLLGSWGGHPMAVGVSLAAARVPEFRTAFDAAVATMTEGGRVEPTLGISAWISLDAARESTLDELDHLHPFGQQNAEPVFGTRGVVFDSVPEIFKELHFRFQLHTLTGRRVYGVAWNMSHNLPPVGRPVDIAYQLQWNRFNGRKWVQLDLQAWREAQR